MSVEAVSWAINKAPVGGNVTARMILVSLADKADEYGRDAWKYTSAIADSIRKSDATVFRTLAWLEEIGVIERGPLPGIRAPRRLEPPPRPRAGADRTAEEEGPRRPSVQTGRGPGTARRNGRGKGRENPISK